MLNNIPQRTVVGLVAVLVIFSTIALHAIATGGYAGILTWDSVWQGNNFTCDAGYSAQQFHYDCGCSNNATWYACVPVVSSAVPPSVTASPGNASVALSWTSASGANGAAVSSYTVGSSTTSGGPYLTTNVGNVLSTTQSGLTNGTLYYFVVFAKDSGGNTLTQSTQVSATPANLAAVAPVVTASDNVGSVDLSWTAGSGPNGTAIASYTYGKSTVSGGPYTTVNVGTARTASPAGVNGTTYYFVVRALNSSGVTVATSTQVSGTPYSAGGGGGGGCFLAGTDISTPTGPKDIATLKAGDEILSLNLETNKEEVSTIGRIDVYGRSEYLVINGTLRVTPTHPFYVVGTTGLEIVKAGDLKVGDILMNESQQKVPITSIEHVHQDTTVYNLVNIEPNNNYFAGGILVHNKTNTQ